MKRGKPSRKALLLIDFMNPLDFAGSETMRASAVRAARRAAMLKRQAAARKVPRIYVNDNFGEWTSSFEGVVERVARSNPAAASLVEHLGPEPGDISILKPRHSGFYGTPLEFLLEELGVERLVITGLATDNCVFATAQDAYVRKFEVWIPADCVAATAGADEAGVLRHMRRTLKARTDRYSGRLWPAR